MNGYLLAGNDNRNQRAANKDHDAQQGNVEHASSHARTCIGGVESMSASQMWFFAVSCCLLSMLYAFAGDRDTAASIGVIATIYVVGASVMHKLEQMEKSR